MDKDLYRVIVEVESYCGTNEVMGGRVGLQASDPSVVHVCVYGRNEVGWGQAGNDNNCLWVTTDNIATEIARGGGGGGGLLQPLQN